MSFTGNGYELIGSFLNIKELEEFNTELGAVKLPRSSGGIRNAERKYPIVKSFSSSEYALEQAASYLSGTPKFVRAILFNKTSTNNWLVSWHQDKTVVVTKEFNEPGWGPWSSKDGVLHVQPPLEVLNSMVTFRVHLDATSAENRCLSVVPGSHKFGILSQQDLSERSHSFCPVQCQAPAGSALVMLRPHLLHASGKGTAPTQRRVLHIEYSSYRLPSGVSWAENE